MGLFTKHIGPVFLKEESEVSGFIEKMRELQEKASDDIKQDIETQIKLAVAGENGEKNIQFELKNSGIDMFVLHDIYLEVDDLSAQIDYLVVTRKRTFVIECKNLIGNIEIDSNGNFIRTYELYGRKVKEGIYSPITQNQRHLNVIKELRSRSKGNILAKMKFEKYFDLNYVSVVVLANPKTYLNAKYAKKDIKNKVIRADQLSNFIIKMNDMVEGSMNENDMFTLAQFYLDNNQPYKSDYAQKYEEAVSKVDSTSKTEVVQEKVSTVVDNTTNQDEDKIKKLKAFRLTQSRKENVKPYYIFNDAQMNSLIDKKPSTKAELLKVSGFGNVKVDKYGDSILKILNNSNSL